MPTERPPKLRAACNECNAAKVKCSGEKDGCVRCRTQSTACVYSESRVGKVTGPRGKRKRTITLERARNPAPPLSPRSHPDSSSLAPSSLTSGSSPGSVDLDWQHDLGSINGLGVSYDDHQLGASPGLGSMDLGLDSSDAFSRSLEQAGAGMELAGFDDISYSALEYTPPTSASQPFHLHMPLPTPMTTCHDSSAASLCTPHPLSTLQTPRHQFDAFDFRQAADSRRRSHTASTPSTSPAPAPTPARAARTDSPTVLACTRLSASLENYIAAELAVPDIVLGIARRATDALLRLAAAQDALLAQGPTGRPPSARVLALFAVVLDQATTLLEAGSAKFLRDAQKAVGVVGGGGAGGGFGGFEIGEGGLLGGLEVDPREQRAWQGRIILREVRNTGRALGRAEALGRRACPGGSPEASQEDGGSSGFRQVRERLAALEKRLQGRAQYSQLPL